MYVEKIQSRRYSKTFYKVVFENKEKLEQFKEVLAFYKEDIIDDRHPEPGDISLDAYVLLNDKVNSIDPDSEEELSFILHEIQDILTLFFYIMEYWYFDNRMIKKLKEIRKTDFDTLSTYIYAAHEDPAILQGETWEHIKSYIESAKNSKS